MNISSLDYSTKDKKYILNIFIFLFYFMVLFYFFLFWT